MSYIHQLLVAEVFASAVSDLFPGSLLVQLNVDTAGFSYDIACSQPVDAQALPLIEEKMRELLKNLPPVQVLDMMRENAANLLEHHQQPLKADQVANCPYNIVQIVKIDNFYDYLPGIDAAPLSQSPPDPSTAIKLLAIEDKIAPGDDLEDYKVITFSGTAADNKQALKQLLKKHTLAKENHPLQLGSDMGLFAIDPHLSPSGFFWSEKGLFLQRALQNLWEINSRERQFKSVATPNIVSSEFYTSWSLDTEDSPPFAIEGQNAYLVQEKFSLLTHYLSLPQNLTQSWPIRLAEWSSLSDETPSSADELPLSTRTAGYRLICCDEQQIEQEIISCLQFFEKTFTILGFRYEWILSSSGKKISTKGQYPGNKSLDLLRKTLSSCGYAYREERSQIALPGPRIELHVKDLLDRSFAVSTLELSLNLAHNLRLKWQEQHQLRQPFLISEMLYTSLEKIIALLIQNHAGVLPWQFTPEHVRILPIGKHTFAYANKVADRLSEEKLRIGIDLADDPLAGKIHRAEIEKIPYMVIIGEKEAKENKITIRPHGQKALKNTLSLEAFIQEVIGKLGEHI